MTPDIPRAAAVGFERAGEEYERGRPSYPDAAVAQLVRALEIGPGRRVLDLAAGTGKLTRLLTPTGAEVVAVEPVAGMRAQLERTTPGVPTLEGTAEQIPLPDGDVDAVTVAQAFHWFDAALAAAEISRVLRPTGRLGVIWNSWDEHVPWVAEVQALVHAHVGDARQQRSSDWQSALASSGRFGELHEETFPHVVEGGLETLSARVSSVSYISALPGADREDVLDAVRAVVANDPATAGRERFVMPYTTQVVWAQRR